MTYREQLEQLMAACTQKGKAYMNAKSVCSSQSSHYVANLKKDWERAEREFEACLDLIMSDSVRLTDTVQRSSVARPQASGLPYMQPR
jgi:hypothetical protein